MSDTQTPDQHSMNKKLLSIDKGDGLTLTPAETTALKTMLISMHQQQVDTDGTLALCQQTNYIIAAALYRRNLQIVRHENDDGSFTVDLVNKPEPIAPTPITH